MQSVLTVSAIDSAIGFIDSGSETPLQSVKKHDYGSKTNLCTVHSGFYACINVWCKVTDYPKLWTGPGPNGFG